MYSDARIPVIVVSGFLGSGKTTLLKKVLVTPELSGSLLIVNEIGEIGIDHLLLERSDDDTVLLDNGCVCCQLRGELQALLVDLMMRRRRGEVTSFERVIIETSGLSDPGAIARTLYGDGPLARDYRLAHVITLVDPTNSQGREAVADIAVAQVAAADLLIITKADRASAEDLAMAEYWARGINDYAPCIVAAHGDLDISLIADVTPFDDVLRKRASPQTRPAGLFSQGVSTIADSDEPGGEAGGHDSDSGYLRRNVAAHPTNVSSFAMSFDSSVDRELFDLFLETLTRLRAADLLRVKGILFFDGEPSPVLIQGVCQVFDKPVPFDSAASLPRHSSLVFITRSITRQKIEQLWHAICNLAH